MCGIFGIYNFNQSPVELKLLNKISERMIFRGPDDSGIFINGNVGIGMRRLAIMDPNGPCQPIQNSKKNIHLVFNGEIYNYLELRQDLEEKGYKFYTDGDVEVLIYLYEEEGVKAINKLNGMFAFSLYDQNKDLLWIARDRLGIKPLYYFNDKNKFLFSSDLLALNQILDKPVSQKSILNYLSYSYIPAPYSIFSEIHKLCPGQQIIIKNNKINKNNYWNLSLEDRAFQNSEAIIELEKKLYNSVKYQLRSDVPLGVLLSGGLDSSSIVKIIRELYTKKEIIAFNASFENKDGLDNKFAKIISKEFSLNLQSLLINDESFDNAYLEILPFLDEPLADSALIPNYLLSKKANTMGIKVLISGAGGDEIFGGYSRHFVNELFTAPWLTNSNLKCFLFKNIFKYLSKNLYYRFSSQANNFVSMISGTNYELLESIIIDKKNFSFILEDNKRLFKDINNNVKKRMKVDLDNYLPNNILALTDKATMISSIEGRVPLLDHELVEYCYSLPTKINNANNSQKGLFKNLMKHKLPKELINRKKEGFNAPINNWHTKNKNKYINYLKNNRSKSLEKVINFSNLISMSDKKKIDKSFGQSIYAIYHLNRWLLQHGH